MLNWHGRYIALDELEEGSALYTETRLTLTKISPWRPHTAPSFKMTFPSHKETLRQAIKLGKGYSPDAKAGLRCGMLTLGTLSSSNASFMQTTGKTTGDELFAALMVDNYRQTPRFREDHCLHREQIESLSNCRPHTTIFMSENSS